MDKKRILVIDDEENIVKMLKTLLEINDYEAETALDGKEGLSKANKYKPDLILLDLVMPNLNGYQVLETLRADETLKSIPVILFTAAPPEVAAKSGSSALEAVDYVLKPFDRMTLSFLLERIKELTSQ